MKKQFLFTLAVLMICGCSDSGDEIDQQNPKEDTIELSQTTLSFDGSEEKQSIYVHSNRDWTLTGGESWCTPSQSNGDDGDEVTFMVMDNNDGKPRKARFYFNCGSASETLTVEQQRGRIIISPSKIEVDILGGEICVLSKFVAQIQIDDDCKNWITKKESSLSNYHKTIFDVEQNKSRTPREGKITYFFTDVNGSEFSETVTVYQAGANLDITVNVPQKGKLAETLADYNSAEIGKLKITGELGAEDFITIRNMPNLIDLDISEVNITTLPTKAFDESTNVENLILPNTLTTIGSNMFSKSALKSVIIPNGVTTIESYAFFECSSLATVTFEKGSQLKTINHSFGRTALTSIEIPASVETIGFNAFFECSSLATVTFEKGSNLKTIGEAAFSGNFHPVSQAYLSCPITSIEIPASVETIEQEAFKNCSKLATVTFEKGSNLKTIGGGYNSSYYHGAFISCKALTSIEIPASVETIEATAFYDCTSLKTVTFEKGSNLKTIGGGYDSTKAYYYGAFAQTKSLATVDMSECTKVTEIGDGAFAGASHSSEYESLQLLKIGTKVPPKLGKDVFHNGLSTYFVLQVPAGCVDAYKRDWKFANITELDE